MPRFSSQNEPVPMLEDPSLPAGWNRIVTQRSSGRTVGMYDVAISDSKGNSFRSRAELARHLKTINSKLKAEDFDFTVWGKPGGKMKSSTISEPAVTVNGSRKSSRLTNSIYPISELPQRRAKAALQTKNIVPNKKSENTKLANKRELSLEVPTRKSSRNQPQEVVSKRPRGRGASVGKRSESPMSGTSSEKSLKPRRFAQRVTEPTPSAALLTRNSKVTRSLPRVTHSHQEKGKTAKSQKDRRRTGYLVNSKKAPPTLKVKDDQAEVSAEGPDEIFENEKKVKRRGRQKKQEVKHEESIAKSDNDDEETDTEPFSIFDEDPNLPAKRVPKPKKWSSDEVMEVLGKKKKQARQRRRSSQASSSNGVSGVKDTIEGLDVDDMHLSVSEMISVTDNYGNIQSVPVLSSGVLHPPGPDPTQLVSSLPSAPMAISCANLPPIHNVSTHQRRVSNKSSQGKQRKRQNSDRLTLGTSGMVEVSAGDASDLVDISAVSALTAGGNTTIGGAVANIAVDNLTNMVNSQYSMISDRQNDQALQRGSGLNRSSFTPNSPSYSFSNIPNHTPTPSHMQQTRMSQIMAMRALHHHNARGRRKIYDPSMAYYDHNYNRPYEESPEAIQQQLRDAALQEQERLRVQLERQQRGEDGGDETDVGIIEEPVGNIIDENGGVVEVSGVGSGTTADSGGMSVAGSTPGAFISIEESGGTSNNRVTVTNTHQTTESLSLGVDEEEVDGQQPIILQTTSQDGSQPGQYVIVRSLSQLPYNLQVVGLDGSPLTTDQIVL